MPTQKRRVIYLSDDDWTTLADRSKRCRLTISAYVRTLLVGDLAVVDRPTGEARKVVALPTVSEFNSRPFTPVPKHR